MPLDISLVPLLRDNYAYLIADRAGGVAAIVDPSSAGPVIARLEIEGLRLTHIFNTHHHGDHTDGNAELKARFGATVIGPEADRHRIPAIDQGLAEGDVFSFGSSAARTISVPGHTSGHIALYFGDENALFCGDTLFSLGCGRLFEGSPATMWHSLLKLRALPGQTRVYCGHEYTQSNCRFALSIDPENPALRQRATEIDRLRALDQPTIPTTLEVERATNPFLRADDPAIACAVGLADAAPEVVFAEIRRRKDHF